MQHEPAVAASSVADRLGHRGDRDVERESLAEGAVESPGGVVGDDDGGGAGGIRVLRLDREGALAPADRAMVPAGKPAKSAASQPGVASTGGPGSAVTAAVTSPLPE